MDSSIQATTLIIQTLSQLGSLSAGGYSGSAGGAFDPQYIEASLNIAFSKNISQDASIVILRAKDVTIDSSLTSIININFSQDASIVAVQAANTSQDASIVDLRSKNTSQDASIVRIDSSINNILTGNTTFGGTKTFSNQIISNNGMKSSDYVEGIMGTGYVCGSTAQFENLTVTEDLNVRTIRNNIIEATNGTNIVNPTVVAIDTSAEGAGLNHDASGWYFNVDPWLNTMVTGFPIVSQTQTESGIDYNEYIVTAVNGGKVYVNFNYGGDVSTKEYPDLPCNNVSFTSWVEGEYYYTATPAGTNQYCQTNLYDIKDGSLYVTATIAHMGPPGPKVTVALYDETDTLYDTISSGNQTGGSKWVTITEDVSLRIRITITYADGAGWIISKPDMTNYYLSDYNEVPNVKGRTFVKNSGNAIISSSVLPWASGTRWLKNAANVMEHTTDEIATAAGTLDGITFHGVSISGQGLYSDNVYLKGNIIADEAYIQSGRIGENGLYITPNGINSGTEGQERFELNAPNQTTGTGGGIYFYDGSTNNNLSIHTNTPIDINNLQQSSKYTISGTDASASTTVTQASALTTYNGPARYLSFKQQPHVSLTSGSVIPNDASAISILPGVFTSINLRSIHNISYTIPSNYTENPGPNRIEHIYTASGTWSVQTDRPKAYNISDEDITYFNIPGSTHNIKYNVYSAITKELPQRPTVNIFGYDTSIYIKYNYIYNNNISIREQVIIYNNDIEVYSYNNYTKPAITFNSAIYSFDYSSKYQQITEITNKSIINYADSTHFFKWNAYDDKELEIAGTVDVSGNITTHGNFTTDNGYVNITGSGSSPAVYTGLLNVRRNVNNYVATFFNDGNNTNRYGIWIQCGLDDQSGSGLNYYITGADGDGTQEWHITVKDGNAALTQASDEKRKLNITDSSLNGLDILKNLKVRDYNWREKDPTTKGAYLDKVSGTRTIGWIAQEVKEVYPPMYVEGPEGDPAIAPTLLIPVLHKAIVQQQEIIDKQQVTINSLEKRLCVVESKLLGVRDVSLLDIK